MASKPRLQVTVGAVDYIFPLDPVDDAGNHVIQKTMTGFPDAVPNSGEPSESNYLPAKIFTLTAPIGVGLKYGHDPHRVWDMCADTRFASGIYPSRLQNNPTIPAECANVQFKVFFHAENKLFMGGVGTSAVLTADEGLLYFDGTDWADTTLKNDIGGAGLGTLVVSSGCEHVGRAYVALRGTLDSTGNAVKIARSSVGSAVVWTVQSHAASANPIAGSPYGLLSDGVTMYVAEWNGSGTILVKSSADDGVTWPTTKATILSSRAPVDGLAAALYGDGTTSPVMDYWLGTAEGLYHLDVSAVTFTRQVTFQHPESAYTGQVLLTPLGLVFTDGPAVYVGSWNAGTFEYRAITDTLQAVPASKQGDITAIAYDNILNELACFKGGTSASSKSTLYIYSFITKLWYCLDQQPTANKATFAAVYSTQAAGVSKLHKSRDHTSTAGHSTPSYFNYISEDPDIQASADFVGNTANTNDSIIRTSRFDGFAPSVVKGVYKQRIRADGLTATEYLGVKFATNGGSLGSQQTLTTGSVGALWTDGATTGVGSSAYDIDAQIIMELDSAATTIPRIRAISWAYDLVPLKDDGTPIRTFTFRISLSSGDYSAGMDINDPKDARAKLETILANAPLVQLAFGSDFPNGVTIGSALKVKMQPYEGRRKIGSVQDQVDLPQDGAGSVLVEFREVI